MSDQLTEWHYAIANQQYGPVSFQALWSMATSGQLTATDLVWREGMPDWRPARDVPELAGALGGPATSAGTGADTGEYDFAPPQPGAAPAANWPSPSHGYAQQQPAGAYPYAQQQTPYGGAVLPYGTYVRTGPNEVRYAGFWIRFAAAFIDGLITGVAGCVVGGCIGGVIGVAAAANHQTAPGGGLPQETTILIQVVSQILGIIINWLYAALFESSAYQATPGKLAVGVRVTDINGQRISFGRATGRHFAKFLSALILCIGYIMAGFDSQKRALHDQMAKTLVTYK